MCINKIMTTYREFREGLEESFSIRVFRSFAISIIAVFLVVTFLFVAYERKTVREDLIKEGKMLAGLMAYSSTTGVFAENRDLVEDSVQGVMSQRNVLSVAIFTADNKALVIEEKGPLKKESRPLSPDEMRLPPPASGERTAKVIDGSDTISVVAPVIMQTEENPEEALYFQSRSGARKQEVIGYVRVVMDKRILEKEMTEVVFQSAAFAFLLLILSATAIFILIRRATSPLTSLTESVRRLGMGESVEKVPVESRDEIGKLAAAFNTMSENLKKREEEKQALEEKLRYSQKMEAVGTLARGIAHDFNNILSTVRGWIYMLEKKCPDQSALLQYTDQIHNSLNKAKNLIGSLIAFSRIQTIQMKVIDLNSLIRKLKPMLAAITGEDNEVTLSLADEGLFISADAVQVEQVLMNLCTNARDAMPDGGVLTIRTEPAIIDVGRTGISGPARSGRYALLSVRDTGAGIAGEIREKVFEPFFSTKEVGRGTGLGLAIVYGIIEQHKGFIDVESERGQGTTFRIYLPLAERTGEDPNTDSGDDQRQER
jgi:signal transduction histidine kinase